MRKIILLALLAGACGGSYTPGTSAGGGIGTPGGNVGGSATIEWTFATGDAGVTTTVDAGTQIRWHNGDAVVHSVVPLTTPPPDPTGNIAAGSNSTTQTISTPGTYQFICGIHGPSMHGTLVVQ